MGAMMISPSCWLALAMAGVHRTQTAICRARAVSVLRDLEELMGGAIPEGIVVETEAFGEALPMGCDDTEWGRQMNRRVELWVASNQSNPHSRKLASRDFPMMM